MFGHWTRSATEDFDTWTTRWCRSISNSPGKHQTHWWHQTHIDVVNVIVLSFDVEQQIFLTCFYFSDLLSTVSHIYARSILDPSRQIRYILNIVSSLSDWRRVEHVAVFRISGFDRERLVLSRLLLVRWTSPIYTVTCCRQSDHFSNTL